MKKNENYHKTQKVELWLSQSDIDILIYAINNVNWNDYDADDYDGESDWAAGLHLEDFENQITEYLEE
mgnify:CR=1 FL=1